MRYGCQILDSRLQKAKFGPMETGLKVYGTTTFGLPIQAEANKTAQPDQANN